MPEPSGGGMGGPAKAGGAATENILTSKLGPLPVWAWGGGAVVGALVLFKLLGGGGSKTPTAAQLAAQQQAAAAYPGSNAPGGSPTMGGTPVYVYSQPGDNAQTTGSSPSFPQGILGAGPSAPLAIGSSGKSQISAPSSTVGINAPQGTSGQNSGTVSVKEITGLLSTPGLPNQSPSVIAQLDPGAQATVTGPGVTGYWGGQSYVAIPILYYGQPGFVNAHSITSSSGGAAGLGIGRGAGLADAQPKPGTMPTQAATGLGRGPRTVSLDNGIATTGGIGRGGGALRISRSRFPGAVHIHRGI